MGKMPYIPLYIGDWEQDTNCISIEAEGALLKLIFKLWKSETKGSLLISFNQLSILLKKTQENALKIVQELKENDVLNIDFLPENKIKIESRRMVKEAAKSKTASINGSKGGRSKKLIKSKTKAKVKLNPEYEYEIDNENEIDNKGGAGGKLSWVVIYPFDNSDFKNLWEQWRQHLVEIKKPYNTFSSEQAALQYLGGYTEPIAIEMIKQSIRNNWKNLRELEKNGKQQFTSDRQERVKSVDNMENIARKVLGGD